MGEISINELLDKIQEEVLKRAGKGFTIEVNAEITKYDVYTRKSPPFWSEGEWAWKLYQSKTDEKYLSEFQRNIDDIYYYDRVERVDMDVSISREVENQLPKGIVIRKTSSMVLYDGRDYFLKTLQNGVEKYIHIRRLEEERKKHGQKLTLTEEKKGRRTNYIEGRRVYITVTDEYAARVFNEVCDSKYTFRNLLLSKYDHILTEIASTWGYPLHGYSPKKELHFEVSSSKVRLRGMYVADMGYDWSIICFKDFGMRDLTSHEQLYGMAIAVIDTLKAKHLELDQVMYTIKSSKDTVCVHGLMPPPPVVEDSTVLQEW